MRTFIYRRKQLYAAVEAGDLARAKHWLFEGPWVQEYADVCTLNAEGETPLVVAARLGNEEMVQMLVEQGASVDWACGDAERGFYTPLVWAVVLEHFDVAEILIEHGARGFVDGRDGRHVLSFIIREMGRYSPEGWAHHRYARLLDMLLSPESEYRLTNDEWMRVVEGAEDDDRALLIEHGWGDPRAEERSCTTAACEDEAIDVAIAGAENVALDAPGDGSSEEHFGLVRPGGCG